MGSASPTIIAVAIIERDNRFLIARRGPDGAFPGYWELPGGKCRIGEHPADCVVREVAEETGLLVCPEPGAAIVTHHYPKLAAEIHVYFCSIIDGEARPLMSEEISWIGWDEIANYRFPEANSAVFEQASVLRSWKKREGSESA